MLPALCIIGTQALASKSGRLPPGPTRRWSVGSACLRSPRGWPRRRNARRAPQRTKRRARSRCQFAPDPSPPIRHTRAHCSACRPVRVPVRRQPPIRTRNPRFSAARRTDSASARDLDDSAPNAARGLPPRLKSGRVVVSELLERPLHVELVRTFRPRLIHNSCHRVPAILHVLRRDPFGQRHDQKARQR
jgi:hypothetical protein